MSVFIQQIFSLLTAPPGNLAYHLVVVFALAAALQSGARAWSRTDVRYGRRLVGGLLVLLGLQFVSFLAAAIAWLGVIDAHSLLPPLDRLVYLFSTVLIIWLWLVPEARRSGDIAALLLALFIVTGFALSTVWWGGQQANTTFNGTWPDQATHIFSILLLLGSLLALALRRPAGWGVGAAVFLLLFAGHVLALLMDPYDQDYSGSLRLAQMAAYPWLVVLALRFPSKADAPTGPMAELPERRKFISDPSLLHDFIDLATLDDPDKLYRILAQAVARLMAADLCMLVSAPEPNGQITFPFGYNLSEEKPIDGFTLDARQTPGIANTMLHSRTLRQPATGTAADLGTIARALRLQRPCGLMVVPLPGAEERSALGLLLASPYSNRTWSAEDQTLLEKLATFIARRLNNVLGPVQPETKPRTTPAADSQIQEAQKYIARIQEENNKLLIQIDQAQRQLSQEKSRAESLAALVARQEELNQRPELAPAELAPAESAQPSIPLAEYQALQAQLEDFQQQVHDLQLLLAENDQTPPAGLPAPVTEKNLDAAQPEDSAGQPAAAQELSPEQAGDIVALTQELRQPLTSIAGYTDMLLGESMGLLGTLQRKFLERIKASVERMTSLADDLIQMSTQTENTAHFKLDPVDLNAVIDDAIVGAMAPLREKNLVLRVDVPEQLPVFRADRDALQQVLTYLLQNAGVSTPPEGEVTLRAQAQIKNHEPGYMLIQVSDTGSGIPSEEITRIFSPLYQSRQGKIPGVGVTAENLAEVKMLVEAHHGRVWVDSAPDEGATFSALFPLANEELGVN